MKKPYLTTIVTLSFLLGILASPGIVDAHMRYGGHHDHQWGSGYEQRGEWNYCPYCGSDFRGKGGYGMMGPGYGHMYDNPSVPYDRPHREPLKREDVEENIQNMLVYSRNPNLKVGKIEDKGFYFEAEITTINGSLVDKLQVDKESGRMRSIY